MSVLESRTRSRTPFIFYIKTKNEIIIFLTVHTKKDSGEDLTWTMYFLTVSDCYSFEVFTVVIVQTVIFQGVTPYRLVHRYQRFGGICCRPNAVRTNIPVDRNQYNHICTPYSILNCTFYAYYTCIHETKNAYHTYCVKLPGPFYVHHENKFSSLAKFVLVLLYQYSNWAMG
jgi:hypothetical protein